MYQLLHQYNICLELNYSVIVFIYHFPKPVLCVMFVGHILVRRLVYILLGLGFTQPCWYQPQLLVLWCLFTDLSIWIPTLWRKSYGQNECGIPDNNDPTAIFPFPSVEACNSENNFTMCPQCDRRCSYWNFSLSCNHVRASYLFDNGATVFFAIFMSLWGKYSFNINTWTAFESPHSFH